MPTASGPGGVLYNTPTGGGLLSGLDPDYQAQQLQLNQAQAFKDGVPKDANGNADYGAMADRLMQLGAYPEADKLMSTGIAMDGMRFAQKAASDPLLTGVGAPAGGQGAGASAPTGSSADPMNAYAHSIGSMESSNNYNALGKLQSGGDRAYGRFQVMGANVGPWTKEVLGQEMTPDQFLSSPEAQDAVFRAKFGQSVQKYGNPMDAASVWFSGQPMARAGNATDSLGTSVPDYVRKFAAGLGTAPRSQATAPQAAPSPAVAQAGGNWTMAPPAPATATAAQSRVAAGAGSPRDDVTAAAGQASDSTNPGPAGAVTDDVYQAAKLVAAQAENADPRTMTLQQQQAATKALDLVQQYEAQQRQPAEAASVAPSTAAPGQPVQVAQNGASDAQAASPRGEPPADVMAAIERMRADQGTPDDKALYLSWAKPGQASAGTAAGAPAADGAAPVSSVHPFAAGSPGVPFASNLSGRPAAPPAGRAIGGGVQPASFPGIPAPAAIPAVAQPMAGGVAGSPGRQPLQAGSAVQPPLQTGSAPASQAPQRVLPSQGNPSMMVDPTMGGLLRGPWVGNPGGYALALRAKAAAYSVIPATKPTGEIFSKLADQIDQGIAREGLITPEVKNYSLARQQGFTGSMMDFHAAEAKAQADAQNSSRLQSDTDPSRIGFAGQQAAATAAGTAAGQNAPAAIAGRAANAAAVGEATKSGDYLGGLPAAYAKQADAARATSDNVDQMLNAAQGFRLGAGAELQQDARKALQGTLGFLGVSDPKLNDPTASYEDFGKMAGVLNRNAAQQVGGRTGVQEMQLIGSTLPSPEMSYDGFRTVASSLKGSADYTIAKQQAAQDWVADPAHRGSLAGFEATFNRSTGPAAFWLNRLRVDQPDLFSRTVQGLGATAQGRALLTKAKAGMAWANSNGLFN